MTRERDFDQILDLWFAERPTEVPDRVLGEVAERIGRQPQRPAWRLRWRHTQTDGSIRWIAAAAAVLIIAIVGFTISGGTPSPGVGGPSSPTPSPTCVVFGGPPCPDVGSPAASRPPTAVPSPSVGVGVEGACDLMSPEEAATALNITSAVTAQSLLYLDTDAVAPFPSWYCEFRSGQTSLFVLRYEEETGANAFAGWKTQSGFEAVSGLGDDALWNPRLTTLYILKGARLVTIMPLGGPDPTLTLEAARAIGAIVVTRM